MVLYRLLALALCAAALAAPAHGQPQSATDDDRERAFIEILQREDPAGAQRYVALRDARVQALAELRRAEANYNGAGPELRGLFARPLVQARKRYAETSLALIDFYDDRDREAIVRYQDEIGKINAAIEARRRTRTDLEKMLAP